MSAREKWPLEEHWPKVEVAEGPSWFDQLDRTPCPMCSRGLLPTQLCQHDDPLCSECCRGQHPRPCPNCAGTGQWKPDAFAGIRNYSPRLEPCPDCGGTGTLNQNGATA